MLQTHSSLTDPGTSQLFSKPNKLHNALGENARINYAIHDYNNHLPHRPQLHLFISWFGVENASEVDTLCSLKMTNP